MKRLVALAVIGILGLSCGGKPTMVGAPEVVTLSFDKMGGRYLHYKASSGVTVNMAGKVSSWVGEITFSARIDTVNPDGSIERRFKFDEFVLGEISSGGTLVPDPEAPGYKGESMWLKLGRDGSLVDWKGLEAVRGRTPDGTSLKDFIVTQVVSLFQPPPESEIRVGSKWQRTVEIPIHVKGGEFKSDVTTDYEVVGFGMKDGHRCVKLKTKMMIKGEGSGERGTKKFWVSTYGEGEGEIWFDYENGYVVEYREKVTATQDHSYERAGKTDVKTETSTIDSEVTIKLIGIG